MTMQSQSLRKSGLFRLNSSSILGRALLLCRNPFVNQVFSVALHSETNPIHHVESQSLRKSGLFRRVLTVPCVLSRAMLSQSLRKSGLFRRGIRVQNAFRRMASQSLRKSGLFRR